MKHFVKIESHFSILIARYKSADIIFIFVWTFKSRLLIECFIIFFCILLCLLTHERIGRILIYSPCLCTHCNVNAMVNGMSGTRSLSIHSIIYESHHIQNEHKRAKGMRDDVGMQCDHRHLEKLPFDVRNLCLVGNKIKTFWVCVVNAIAFYTILIEQFVHIGSIAFEWRTPRIRDIIDCVIAILLYLFRWHYNSRCHLRNSPSYYNKVLGLRRPARDLTFYQICLQIVDQPPSPRQTTIRMMSMNESIQIPLPKRNSYNLQLSISNTVHCRSKICHELFVV